MRKIIVGVMGPGENAAAADLAAAYELGELIARSGWVLLTGGRNAGVMDAASRGAKAANGLTVGILPSSDLRDVSEAVDIAIATGMGSARNQINILSCDAIVACGMGAGTASEVALAIKAKKKVVLLNSDKNAQVFFTNLNPQSISIAQTPLEAINLVAEFLKIINQ